MWNGFYTELYCTIPVSNLWPYLKTGKSTVSLNLESQNRSLGGISGGLTSNPLFRAELILTLEQAAWGFAHWRLGHNPGPRLQGLYGHLLSWFTISLGNVFSCCPGGSVLFQTLILPLRTSMKSQASLQLIRKLKGALNLNCITRSLTVPVSPDNLSQSPLALCRFWTTLLCQRALNSGSKCSGILSGNVRSWNKCLAWCPMSMKHKQHLCVKENPSHSREMSITVSEWTPNVLLFHFQGNFLSWLATSKDPVPLSHLLAIFFSLFISNCLLSAMSILPNTQETRPLSQLHIWFGMF